MSHSVGNLFSQCPHEVIQHLFGFLDANSLGRAALVCRLFKDVSETNDLWKQLYIRDFPKSPLHVVVGAPNWKKNYSENYEHTKTIIERTCSGISRQIPGLIFNPKNPPIVHRPTIPFAKRNSSDN